jgi:sn-glycerol 3-phosphate transport system permease protein
MSSPPNDKKARMWFPVLVLMNLLPNTWRGGQREGMIENRPGLTLVSHVVLAIGIAIVALPVYITFVASTLAADEVLKAPMPLVQGHTSSKTGRCWAGACRPMTSAPVDRMMLNSLITADRTFGKITISLLSAFAIVYFAFRCVASRSG